MKFIIEIQDGIDPQNALALCGAVIAQGTISKTSLGPQFCFHTVFSSGVEISVTKRRSGTQRFGVRKGQP